MPRLFPIQCVLMTHSYTYIRTKLRGETRLVLVGVLAASFANYRMLHRCA